MIYSLTQKQLLELKFWVSASSSELINEASKLGRYQRIFSGHRKVLTEKKILEIGTGPEWGLLPKIDASIKWGVDPLYDAYYAMGILKDRNGILAVSEPFELWDTNEQFDEIYTMNALDHGEMGFYLIPKIWRMLAPGGRLFIHVHLRPAELLNLVHDHSLTEDQLDKQLRYTNLKEIYRRIFPKDVDNQFCPALVGVWEKP